MLAAICSCCVCKGACIRVCLHLSIWNVNFQLYVMTTIWILDENRKCCDHINVVLTKSSVQSSGEKVAYIREPMLFIFGASENILHYIS